jgi:flagellar biosynthetic protein FliR
MTISLAAEPALVHLLASLRIIAWLLLVPPFSNRGVPVMAKVVLAVGLSFAVAPEVVAEGVPTGSAELLVVAVTQVAIGTAIGFVTMLLLSTIAAAGTIVDVFGGFSMAQAFDPMSMQMNTVFGKFHSMLATMLLFATGGHLLVIGGLLKTFEFLPLGQRPEIGGASAVFVEAFTMFFVTAVQIALPLVAVLFIADLGLALLTKVAPQMNALNVMFPMKIGLTLLLVGLSFPVLPDAISRLVELANEATAALAGAG